MKQHFSLTTGQLLIKYGESYSPKGTHNLGTRMDIREQIDEGLLRQAISLAAYRIPSLNLRIVKSGKNAFEQYVSEDTPEATAFSDVSCLSDEEIDKLLVKLCGTPFPNDNLDVQLYKIMLFRTEWGHIVFLKFHHSLLDAFGIMTVVSYIDSVYDALVNKKPLPEQLLSPEKMIEKENQYPGSKRYAADKAWFEEIYRDEFEFKPFVISKKQTLRARLANPMTAKCGFANLMIPDRTVGLVNASAEKHRVSPGVFYTLALRSFIASKTNSDDVVFNSVMACRSTLLQKKSGCSLANALPLRSNISKNCTFAEAIGTLSLSLHELYKHAGFNCEDAFGLLGKACRSETVTAADPVSFTYQPFFNFDESSLNYVVQRVSTGKTFSKFYLSVMPYDNSGNMYANYDYFADCFSRDDINYFHSFMLRFVENGALNPDKTISRIVEESL